MMQRMIFMPVLALMMVLLGLGIQTDTVDAAANKQIPGTDVRADRRVVEAFTTLGFTVEFDEDLEYAGVFSIRSHAILVKRKDGTAILHEMGHFVSRLRGGADEKLAFVRIYRAEKKKYAGTQRSYVTKNSKEYFAQSFAEFTRTPKALRRQRPRTYQYIREQVRAISESDVETMEYNYGWAW